MRVPIKAPSLLFAALLICPTAALGGDGQPDLEKAIDLKLSAPGMEDLSRVASLCETAIEKGLDAENISFAKELLTSSLYERAELLCESSAGKENWPTARKSALSDLEKVISWDKKFGKAHLLIARLHAIGGDLAKARAALDLAVEVISNDNQTLSEVFFLRSQTQEDQDQKLADLDQAVKLDPNNTNALNARAVFQLMRGKTDQAIADFDRLLEKDSSNILARLAVAETLRNARQYDESMKHLDRIIEKQPIPLAYALRAQLWVQQKKLQKAIADLNEALKLDSNDVRLLLMRAQLYYEETQSEQARKDCERVLELSPDSKEAIELHSLVLASLGEFDEAISQIRKLVEQDTNNFLWKLQLAIYLNAGGQSQQAIKQFTEVLRLDPGNAMAYRGRADAYLNTGEHFKAVSDYNIAIKTLPDDSGLLNNFAWVLATSPDDQIRDGKRAVEIGTKACELTKHEQAHILSTLAAAFAETGDFESARKWSRKAVELSDESIKDDLKKELESYLQEKPWRERKQETDSKADGEKEIEQ